MALRDNLQSTATRLIDKFGDTVQTVTIVATEGATEFDPPTLTPTSVDIRAVVTGSGKWADGVTILSSDLMVLVSGASAVADVGGSITINSAPHKIIQKTNILATGTVSAVRYFVRRG